MKRLVFLFATLFACLQTARANDDILTTAASTGSFKTLTSLVVAANLDEVLQGKGEFTVFAPTDEAFAKLPKETLATLLKPENRESLAAILKYHVLPRAISVPKTNSHPLESAKTLLGKSVKFDRNGTEVKVNNAQIKTRNIRCSNGLIHVIDAVLIPPQEDKTIVGTATKAGNFKTLLAAAKAAGLLETLSGKGPLTVLAPSDKAFKSLPKKTLASLLKPENKQRLTEILKYHVIAGKVTARDAVQAGTAKTVGGQSVQIAIKKGQLTVNNSNVTANDLEASNGIIHVIDKVLLPKTSNQKSNHSAKASKTQRATIASRERPEKEITITSDWKTPVVRDGIVADKLIIRVGGAGKVRLTNVKASKVETSIGGGGSVSISGTVGQHNAKVSGGAVLRAKDLISKATEVRVYGGGDAEVNATESLSASASAGAILRYVATDAKVTKSVSKYADVRKIH